MQKTRTVNKSDIAEKWFVIDAAGRRLGRVASVAAELLLGKHDVNNRDYQQPKSHVIVLNAARIDVPVRKQMDKIYTTYSGYPSGLKKQTMEEALEKYPSKVVERAIKGMLPKNTRGREIFANNLSVNDVEEHRHQAQESELIHIDLDSFKL